jgi:hypothetical protein
MLSLCQLNENGICRGLTNKLNNSSCRSSGSAPIISHTVASNSGDVYQLKKIGSCRSGCIKCCTPHISSLSVGNGGNCLPTARTYFHRLGSSGPALARSTTRAHASLNFVSHGSLSSPSTCSQLSACQCCTVTNPVSSSSCLSLDISARHKCGPLCDADRSLAGLC